MVGVALSVFAMYYWFLRALDDFKFEIEVVIFGDVKIVCLPRKLVEVGVSGDVRTQKLTKPVIESEWCRNEDGQIEFSCDECGGKRFFVFNIMTDEEFDKCFYDDLNKY